jgi:hypothetical protein
MFSANENLLLRQHKRRVVGYVEATIPEAVLDRGVNVMVMQVQCTAPGCVPIETCIIIVFPKSTTELMPGLPESAGQSFKTKVLKPMADIVEDDVLDVLPPTFIGGRQPSVEQLCVRVRDAMLGQVTQLFGTDETDSSRTTRTLVARYLQASLDDYVRNQCQPPEWGQAFPEATANSNSTTKDTVDAPEVPNDEGSQQSLELSLTDSKADTKVTMNDSTTTRGSVWATGGNVTLRRPLDTDSFIGQQQRSTIETNVPPPGTLPNRSNANTVFRASVQCDTHIAVSASKSSGHGEYRHQATPAASCRGCSASHY